MDYIIGLDDSQLRNGAAQVNRQFDSIGQHAEQVGNDIDSAFKKAGGAIGAYFAVDKAQQFASEILRVRGEMQSLQISFEVLLGSQEKAVSLFNEMKNFAVSTPMQLGDLAGAAQTMLGFGIAAEEVMPMLQALGDISMGNSQKFQSLALAFSQMSATGKLMGQDLLQMINAGFNPLNEISKKTGKTVAELKEQMSQGAISAKMVADAFKSASGEGGQFAGMLEKQSKGLNGAMSNLEGAWQDALNSMGEQSEGVFLGVIDLATDAVKNFDKLGTAILTVVAAYGEYKGSLMIIQAYQNMIAGQEAAIEAARQQELQTLAAKYSATQTDTAATEANTAAKQGEVSAIEAEIMAIQQELQAKLAVAEAAHSQAIADAETAAQIMSSSAQRVTAAETELVAAQASGDATRIAAAETELAAAKKDMATAADMKFAAAQEVAATATNKATAQQKLNNLQTELDVINKNKSTAATGLWTAATQMATTAMNSLKAAFMSNPFGMALVAITSLIGLLSMFKKETEKSTDALNKFREAVTKEQNQLAQYKAILDHTKAGTKAHAQALNNINKIAQAYNTTELKVNDTIQEQKKKLDELTEAIKEQSAAKILAEASSKAKKDAMDAEAKAMDKLVEKAHEATHEVVKEVEEEAKDGVMVTVYRTVDEASTHIQQITDAAWMTITTHMAEHSQAIADALAEPHADVKKIIGGEVEAIEEMLRGMGATDEEIKAFHDDLYDYVDTSAKGFLNANKELYRAQAQLKGYSAAVEQAAEITNESIKGMNYEQLEAALQSIKGEMDEINARKLQPEVGDTSRLEYLESLLNSIKNLMGETLTAGSDAELSKRLSDLKKKRDNSAFGSAEWTDYNNQIGKLEKELSSHKKSYAESRSSGRKSSHNNPADEKLKREKKEQEIKELREEQARDRERAAKDLAFETEQNEINLLEEGNEKTIRQLKLNFEKQQEEIRRGYEDLIQEKINQARRLFEADPKNEKKVFKYDYKDYMPSEAEQALYGTMTIGKDGMPVFDVTTGSMYKSANMEYRRGVEERFKVEQQAMREFLREYGDYEEKKKAITDDFNAKIAAATTEGEKLTLQRQMQEALQNLDMEKFKKDINWEQVFSNLDSVSLKTLQTLKKQLKDALSVKDISAENAKVIAEQLANVERQITKRQSGWREVFGLVIPELEEQKRLIEEAAAAQERLIEAEGKQKERLVDIIDAQQEITDFLTSKGKTYEGEISMGNMQGIMDLFKGDNQSTLRLSKLFGELNKAEGALTESTEALGTAQGEAAEAAEAAGGNIANTVAATDKIVHKVNDNVQSANEIFKQMGLEDTKFGKGFNSLAESSQYATQAWESLKSSNFMGVANGVYGSLRTLGEALGAWGLAGFGSSDKNLLDDIERLTASNEALRFAVDELTDEMKEGSTANALETYNKIQDDINKSMANTQEMMSRSAAAYSNGFLGVGGKHSSNSKINDKVTTQQWQRVTQIVGHSVRSASDFFNLSSEQMYKVAKEAPEIYGLIKSLADDGYQDAAQFMDDYIDYWRQLQEAEDAYFEKMSGTSLDSIVDEFTSALMDMDSKSSDFSKNFEKYMQQAIINAMVSDTYEPLLKDWYKSFATAMENGMTQAETNALKEQWDNIVQQGIAERNALRDAFGWTNTEGQDSTKRGFTTASQDSIDELNGRFTAVQMSTTHIEEMLSSHIVDVAAIRASQADRGTQLSEMTNLIVIANNNLEAIAKNTRELYGIREDIASIKRNTDKL